MTIIGKGRIQQIIAGLTVLAKYRPDENPAAQHDELLVCGPPPEEMDPQDCLVLEEANWKYADYYGDRLWLYFT